MAGPVGHLFCALAFLSNSTVKIDDVNKYFVGNIDPDKRYVIKEVSRAQTHAHKASLEEILLEPNDLIKGQKLHIWLDKDRSSYIEKKFSAYKYLPKELTDLYPNKSHILKAVEEMLLFPKIKEKINSNEIFAQIYTEEHELNIPQEKLQNWHTLLRTYLDNSYRFDFFRYAATASVYLKTLPASKENFLKRAFNKVRTFGLLCYLYYKIQSLSQNVELQEIIFSYYDKRLNEVFSNL